MPRLIVQVVANTVKPVKTEATTLNIVVSVSRADTGASVTQLKKENFRLTNLHAHQVETGILTDAFFNLSERTLDPDDKFLSGIYDIEIGLPSAIFQSYLYDKLYAFGVLVTDLSMPTPKSFGKVRQPHPLRFCLPKHNMIP